MIIECPYCKANVHTKIIAEHESHDLNDPFPFIASLTECPSCKNSLLAGHYIFDSDEVDVPVRLWPSPKRYLSWLIPSIVKTSLEEADRCFRTGAYIACVAMCGRALEGICRHFETKSQYIAGGIDELAKKDIIDGRLLKWSQELHRHRNIAAHATDEPITKEDAEDLLDFVLAICDYVFVLNTKFEKFIKRKKSKNPMQPK